MKKSIDPITLALGRDIASVVYRMLFFVNIGDVNAEYRSSFRSDEPNNMFRAITFPNGDAAFNWRVHFGGWIFRTNELDYVRMRLQRRERRDLDEVRQRVVAKLPKHY
jgi:hypothetical protein